MSCQRQTSAGSPHMFPRSRGRSLENVYMLIIEVVGQAVVKPSSTTSGDELFDDNVHQRAESHGFDEGIFRHLIRSPNTTMPVAYLVSIQAERAVSIECRFWQEVIPKIRAREEAAPLSPLSVLSLIHFVMSKKDKTYMKKPLSSTFQALNLHQIQFKKRSRQIKGLQAR